MFWFISSALSLTVFMAISHGDNSMGRGLWNIKSISKHEQNEGQTINFDIVKRKLNRTNDAYNASCDFEVDFDYSLSVYIDICKHVDGGCKQVQVISESSMCGFIEKHAKKNAEAFLSQIGNDPPEFPIKAGHHEITNFVIDYCSLPSKAAYGVFEATLQILNGSNCVGIVKATVEFYEDEDKICGDRGEH